MRKVLPIIIVFLVIVVGVYIFAASKSSSAPGAASDAKSTTSADASMDSNGDSNGDSNRDSNSPADLNMPGGMSTAEDEGDDTEGMAEEDDRPAAEVYKSADEALQAVKKGAVDYDDLILEQFTKPGENCSWCGEFYKSLRDMVVSPNSSEDEKSYYSELLAISGKVENVSSLVDAIKSAGDNEKGDIYAEALELSLGGDDVVKYLGEQLDTDNNLLKESSVAALTNQGGQSAAEILYKQTVKNGDPDGYYHLGIGLGEYVPDEATLPYVQELAQKRDQYSHLAVKAMLNSGIDGLKAVFDLLGNSTDPENDKTLLKDAVDHVSVDDDSEPFLKEMAQNGKTESVRRFAQEALDSVNKTDEEPQAAVSEGLASPQ